MSINNRVVFDENLKCHERLQNSINRLENKIEQQQDLIDLIHSLLETLRKNNGEPQIELDHDKCSVSK